MNISFNSNHKYMTQAPHGTSINTERYRVMVKKRKTGKITIDTDLCKGCYLCISVCPGNLIVICDKLNQKGYYPAEFTETDDKETDRKCTGCALCATVCPDIAIGVYRE